MSTSTDPSSGGRGVRSSPEVSSQNETSLGFSVDGWTSTTGTLAGIHRPCGLVARSSGRRHTPRRAPSRTSSIGDASPDAPVVRPRSSASSASRPWSAPGRAHRVRSSSRSSSRSSGSARTSTIRSSVRGKPSGSRQRPRRSRPLRPRSQPRHRRPRRRRPRRGSPRWTRARTMSGTRGRSTSRWRRCPRRSSSAMSGRSRRAA